MDTPPAAMLADIRAFAAPGGLGFYVIETRSRGPVPIWIADINGCTDDEALVDLILKSISE